jgi:hypothetical protein
MHQKILNGTFLALICVLFIVCSGCTSVREGTPVSATHTPVTTALTTVATPVTTLVIRSDIAVVGTLPPRDGVLDGDGTFVRDAAFNAIFMNSSAVIVNKTVLVIQAMVPGTTSLQPVYSPSVLYLRAEDLEYTTGQYYDQIITMKADTPENEAKRIAYLQFLYPARNAAGHIADAAEAESYGNYENALEMATLAKGDLQNIEENPALPPTTPYNTLNVFLNEYIGRMQDKVILREMNERLQREDRFPRLP